MLRCPMSLSRLVWREGEGNPLICPKCGGERCGSRLLRPILANRKVKVGAMSQLDRTQNLEASSWTCSTIHRPVLVRLALAAVVLSAPPVRADAKTDNGAILYPGPGLCVYGRSSLVKDSIYYPNGVTVLPSIRTFDACAGNPWPDKPMPAGHVALRAVLWIWNSNSASWQICRDPDWRFGDSALAGLVLQYPYGGPPCGAGYYGVNGGAAAWDGSAWRGDWVWSGHLYLQ
jgi:hypothetical protein